MKIFDILLNLGYVETIFQPKPSYKIRRPKPKAKKRNVDEMATRIKPTNTFRETLANVEISFNQALISSEPELLNLNNILFWAYSKPWSTITQQFIDLGFIIKLRSIKEIRSAKKLLKQNNGNLSSLIPINEVKSELVLSTNENVANGDSKCSLKCSLNKYNQYIAGQQILFIESEEDYNWLINKLSAEAKGAQPNSPRNYINAAAEGEWQPTKCHSYSSIADITSAPQRKGNIYSIPVNGRVATINRANYFSASATSNNIKVIPAYYSSLANPLAIVLHQLYGALYPNEVLISATSPTEPTIHIPKTHIRGGISTNFIQSYEYFLSGIILLFFHITSRNLNLYLGGIKFQWHKSVKPIKALKLDPRLYRVFNDLDLQKGGRFYGAQYQSLSEEKRKRILINGQLSIELDFKSLHLAMLYHLEGLPFDINQDGYSLDNYHPELRKIIKLAFQILLNSSGLQQAKIAIKKMLLDEPSLLALFNNCTDKSIPLETRILSLINSIKSKHEPIRKYFHSGIGLKLQRIDSDIAEKILLRTVDLDIPCLCIHDSFIVPIQHENTLKQLMQESYKETIREYYQKQRGLLANFEININVE
ncbi:MAG: hypothetical protein HPY57_02235 [Ignavibacteria bacterium]|nr:hypothetical protein [Ignavibacteria bacterium]